MLLLTAVAIAASAPSPAPPAHYGATARGQAVIRIVSAVRLSFDGRQMQGGTPAARATTVRGDGVAKRVNLIEFQ